MNRYQSRHVRLVAALIVLTAASDDAGATDEEHYSKAYEFTEDWFTWNLPVWKRILAPLAGKPDLHYLEVGVFEGRSALWVLEHILTDPTSRVTGIESHVLPRLRRNLEKSGQAERVRLIDGYSQTELKRLPAESFDILYVDGSHTADDVLADAVLGWELLKLDGLLIFDDYDWDGSYITGRGPMPAVLVPRPAIDAFLAAYANEIEPVYRGYQVIVRKRRDPCAYSKGSCSPIGSYTYLWSSRKLVSQGTGETVELTDPERLAIEWYLLSEDAADPPPADSVVCSLRERLGLQLGPISCPGSP